jgi:RDD family
VLEKIRRRARELREIWKRVGLVLSILSALKAVREFQHRAGPFIYIGAALLVLAVAILFTIPIKSVRLLAGRLVAFIVDLTLLGLLTTAVVGLLFKSRAIKPSGIVSMAIVWTWFFFFVLFDWRFSGTPGKLILGLKLRTTSNATATLLKCLARSSLVLLVPLIAGGRILTILTASRLGFFAKWSIGIALLSLFPLSIAFCGGQSLPDLLLGTAVLGERSNANRYPVRLNRQVWLSLLIASLLAGVVSAFTSSMANGNLFPGRELPMPPITTIERTGGEEARIGARLWSYLQEGVPSPNDFLQDVRVISAIGELPSGSDGMTPAVPCLEAFKAKKSYTIVREQISSETPTFIKTRLFENFIRTLSLYGERPAFHVFELSTRESFGVFSIESSEDYTFCSVDSEGTPVDSLVDLNGSLGFEGSINELALLFLGDLDTYSQVEKVPIWLH